MNIAFFEDHTYEMEMIYIIDMFLVIQVSGLVEIFNTGIFSDTINCYMLHVFMVVLLIELYLLIPLWMTLTIFHGHNNVEQF